MCGDPGVVLTRQFSSDCFYFPCEIGSKVASGGSHGGGGVVSLGRPGKE